MSTRAHLTLYLGCMFSGKSSRLVADLTTSADTGLSALYINHSDDIRDVEKSDSCITTHHSSFSGLSEKIDKIKTKNLLEINVTNYHVIGIDECQFFEDLFEAVTLWLDNDKIIICSGLDGDFCKNVFGQTLKLIPHAEKVEKLNARCYLCLEELKKKDFHGNYMSITGSFTARTDGQKEQKVIGGADKYIPVCRYHHKYFL